MAKAQTFRTGPKGGQKDSKKLKKALLWCVIGGNVFLLLLIGAAGSALSRINRGSEKASASSSFRDDDSDGVDPFSNHDKFLTIGTEWKGTAVPAGMHVDCNILSPGVAMNVRINHSGSPKLALPGVDYGNGLAYIEWQVLPGQKGAEGQVLCQFTRDSRAPGYARR